jgi:hypothetical protein
MNMFKRLCGQNDEWKFKKFWDKLDDHTGKQRKDQSQRPANIQEDFEALGSLARDTKFSLHTIVMFLLLYHIFHTNTMFAKTMGFNC